MRYVVVGASAAGLAAMRAIQREDASAEIIAISAESAPFYFRPMVVELISRGGFAHDMKMAPPSLEKVDWRLGVKVTKVEPKQNKVWLTNGESIEYDFLILASGSKPDLSYLKPYLRFVDPVHSHTDMVRIQRKLGDGTVLVTGGGYVAIEVIRQLHNRGNKVLYFAQPDYFWTRHLPGVESNDIEALLKAVGVPPEYGVEIVDVIDWDGSRYAVTDSQNRTHIVDAILAIPVEVPEVEFLQGSGIHCEEGVIVDEQLCTNIPNVFACGDCAQVLDLKHQINRVNFGWRSAEKQGELAGQNAVGKNVVYIPNSQDFYFLDLLGKNLLDRWADVNHTPLA